MKLMRLFKKQSKNLKTVQTSENNNILCFLGSLFLEHRNLYGTTPFFTKNITCLGGGLLPSEIRLAPLLGIFKRALKT